MSTTSSFAVEARQLYKRFGIVVAVDGVSFQVNRGEIFGFLGSNGCGKSTTMKMLTGLLPPTEGTATLFGSCAVRRFMMPAFQNPLPCSDGVSDAIVPGASLGRITRGSGSGPLNACSSWPR